MQFSESERREGGRRPEAAPAPPQLRDVSREEGREEFFLRDIISCWRPLVIKKEVKWNIK